MYHLYLLVEFICIARAGMVLPAYMEVWKILHKARHIVDGHNFLVAETASQDDQSPVSNGAGMTGRQKTFLIQIFPCDPNLI